MPSRLDPEHKEIQIYQKDWTESERLGVDLVRVVFHEYLRAIGKNDDRYVVSRGITVTERDYQKRRVESPECLSGHRRPVNLVLNIAGSFPYASAPAYVNGMDFDSPPYTDFRVYRSQTLCTEEVSAFSVTLGTFARNVFLYGGDRIVLFVPDGREIFQARGAGGN